MTARDALAAAERRLAEAGVDTPRADAEWLVAHLLGTTRSGLAARLDDEVEGLEPLLTRREAREPLAYVVGEWGFRRLTLRTDARALVPRPETETLVERALALAEGIEQPRILDVGVGSGAIALALKDERPDAQVTGIDVSADALALAHENAVRLGLEVELREGDGAAAAAEGWDVVVANPPYVESLEDVPPELRWEPELALLARGEHERLARAAKARFVVFEVGDGQADGVAEMLERLGWAGVAITADLTGRDRVVEGRLPRSRSSPRPRGSPSRTSGAGAARSSSATPAGREPRPPSSATSRASTTRSSSSSSHRAARTGPTPQTTTRSPRTSPTSRRCASSSGSSSSTCSASRTAES